MTGLDKALDIMTALFQGEEIKKNGCNAGLYQEYSLGTEVYDIVMEMCKKMSLEIYEYKDGLYMTAGLNNPVFGYRNEEIKKELGIRYHRELYLCYFVIYEIMNYFSKNNPDIGMVDSIRSDTVIAIVDEGLASVIHQLKELSMDEVEANSFREIAMVWEDMPLVQTEDVGIRASRGSKTGFVKLVFNFMVNQGLLLENAGSYYPKERFLALMTQYYDANQGRLYQIMKGEKEDATDK